jgi:putative membrane protein insertion efficiency factor/ribonuclease P protein component
MLPASRRLHNSDLIRRTLREGRKHGSRHVVTHVRCASGADVGPARAAFAVSKSVGNSVVRHRVTRQLRAAILPLLQQLPPGTDIVVRALPAAASAQYAQLDSDLMRCLARYLPTENRVADVADTAETTGSTGSTGSTASSVVSADPPRGALGTTLFILGTPIRLALLGLVMAYRSVISPILPPTCRYHPSCSAFAVESLQVHGAGKGSVLAGWRLLRCHPWTAGGLDPVPQRGRWRPDIYPDGAPRLERTVGCGDEPRATSAVAPT